MPKNAFPDGIGEKLPLDEPTLWDVDDFQGSDRMPVVRGNAALEKVFRETKTKFPKLVASVRWSVLRMPYVEYANAIGLSSNGYKPMERDQKNTGAHREKVTKLLAHWEQSGISSGIREQLLDLLLNPELLELDESCTDLLSAVELTREQSSHLLGPKHMSSFYHRVGYELGHQTVEDAFPSIYNTLWQRERTGTVPEFSEVLRFVDTMYRGKSETASAKRAFRHAQAEAVWTEVQANSYLDRSLEEPLATILTAIEKYVARNHQTTLTAKSLGDVFGFGQLHAEQLIQCELIEIDVIAPVAHKVLPSGEVPAFLSSWQDVCEIEARRESFGTKCTAAMAKRGLTAGDIGRLLDVKAPEERGMDAVERSQRYRPDAEIRSVIFRNHVSRQVPVEAIIQVLSEDDRQAGELRESYFLERERFFKRSGYRKTGQGLRMRIMRELANVQMKELAKHFLPKNKVKDPAAVRAKDLELQRLERQEGKKPHTITFKQVFGILERIAAEASEAALQRLEAMGEMDESLTQFTTVEQMVTNLVKGMKGADAISEAMRHAAAKDSEWLRADQITHMSEGSEVCALPSLRLMHKVTLDKPLPDEVKRDWYERFPGQLQAGIQFFGQARTPIAKAMCTLIATKEGNPMDFFKDRTLGVVPTIGTKALRDLNTSATVEWRHLHQYLLAVGLQPTQMTYQYVRTLHETGDMQKTLRTIVPMMEKLKMEIHPVNLPGATLEDLKPFLRKR